MCSSDLYPPENKSHFKIVQTKILLNIVYMTTSYTGWFNKGTEALTIFLDKEKSTKNIWKFISFPLGRDFDIMSQTNASKKIADKM